MERKKHKPILLLGVPRSGSTWLQQVFASTEQVRTVHEPDNELNSFLGLLYKKNLPRFPYFAPHQIDNPLQKLFLLAAERNITNQSAKINQLFFRLEGLNLAERKDLLRQQKALRENSKYFDFWAKLFLGGAKVRGRVLIKSVHSLLALESLQASENWEIIVLKRHPMNTFSSYYQMKMADSDRKIYQNSKMPDRLVKHLPKKVAFSKDYSFNAGIQLGLFYRFLAELEEKALAGVRFLDYESIIDDPFAKVKEILNSYHFDYGAKTENFLKEHMQKGSGYQTKRDLTRQAEVWKDRLGEAQIEQFIEAYRLARGTVDFKWK